MYVCARTYSPTSAFASTSTHTHTSTYLSRPELIMARCLAFGEQKAETTHWLATCTYYGILRKGVGEVGEGMSEHRPRSCHLRGVLVEVGGERGGEGIGEVVVVGWW